MALAFESVCGVPDAFRDVHMAGRTDAWILTDAAAAHGIPPDSPALGRFRDAYLHHLVMELEKPGARKGVMLGVRELLGVLGVRDESYRALLTVEYDVPPRI